MGYEIFTRKRSRTTTPSISINKTGRIGLNHATTVILQKNAVEFVLILWDAERRHLGIRPVVKKDSRAYGVSYNKSSSMFSAKTFLEYIGYDKSETRSLPATWNETENMLEIEIPAEHLKGHQRKLSAVEGGKASGGKK